MTLQQQKAQADDQLTQIPALKLELQNKVNELAELKKVYLRARKLLML